MSKHDENLKEAFEILKKIQNLMSYCKLQLKQWMMQ